MAFQLGVEINRDFVYFVDLFNLQSFEECDEKMAGGGGKRER